MRPLKLCALALSCAACGSNLAAELSASLFPVSTSRACPQGWAPNGAACDAVLPAGRCDAGTMPVIGSTSCVGVGNTVCGPGFEPEASGWGCTEVMPSALCTGATMEVLGQTQCQDVGDCSAAFPPAGATLVTPDGGLTLAAAIAAAPDGGVIALDTGTYVGALTLDRDVTLVGRCAAKVTLQAPDPANYAGLDVGAGAAVTVSGVTVTGFFNGAIVRTHGALTAQHVVFDGNQITGVQVTGGTLELDDSVVRNGVPDGTGDWGVGLYVVMGGKATLKRSSIAHNLKGGIIAQDRMTQLLLDGVVVRDTRLSAGVNGDGVVVVDGASGEIHNSALVHNSEAGLLVEAAALDTRATLDGSVIRDTVPRTVAMVDPMNPSNKQYNGNAIEAQGRVSVTVTKSSLLRSGGDSFVTVVAPARAEVSDTTIYSTQVAPNGDARAGFVLQAGSTATLTRTAIAQSSACGAQVQGSKTSLELVDSLIDGTLALGSKPSGQGIDVALDAGVSLSGSAVTGSAGVGLFLAAGGAASATNSVIGWNTSFPDGTLGRGIEGFGKVTLNVASSALVANREVALVVGDVGTFAQVTGSVIRDTLGDTDGFAGRGVNVQQGAHLLLDDCLLSGNRDVGLMVAMAGSTAVLENTVVTGTKPRDMDGHFGINLSAMIGGRLDLKKSQVLNASTIAVIVAQGAATIESSLIAHNPVALQVQNGSMLQQVPELPMTVGPLDVLVTDDTLFDDNATRVGTGDVPLPEAPQ